MTSLIQRARTLPSGGIVALALLVLTVLLWLPFGLNIGFTGDDWIYFHQVETGSIMSQAAPTRLFIPIPWLAAYQLAPGQFAGINLFIALMIFGKGVLIYGILRRLNLPAALAFATGALTILLPADTGIFYMGGLHNQFALVCYLLAVYLLLIYWRRPRLLVLVLLIIAQMGTVGISEQAYPLIAFAPLILLSLRPKIDRRWIKMALLWWLVPLLNGLFYLWIVISFPRAFAYQGSLITHPSPGTILTSLFNDYLRHFVTGWLSNFATTPPLHLLLGIIAGFGVGGVCWRLSLREPGEMSPRQSLIFALAGLIIIGLAVLLYLPTSLRDETLRTFYFSSVGAALTLVIVFRWLAHRSWGFPVLVGLFALVGMLHLLDQHQGYVDESKRQQAAYIQLTRVLPNAAAGSGIVIVDQTPDQAFSRLIHGDLYAEDSLPLFYDDPSLEGALCLPGDFGTTDAARCRFSEDGLTLPSVRTRVFVRRYDQLIFVRYDGAFSLVTDLTPYVGHSVVTYQPEKLTQPSDHLPPRLTALFGS